MPSPSDRPSPCRRLGWAAALALASAPACAGDPEPGLSETAGSSTAGGGGEPAPLVAASAWTPVDGAADPLADHRPTTVECGLGGVFVESEELEIDTNFCNYAMLVQPSLVDVPASATLTISLRHFDLTAAAPATAHVAVILGDATLWERVLVIPGPAEVITLDVPAPAAFPAGTPVHFHLHNHGQNTWIFTGVTVTP